jgi:hypothetical protein
MLPYPQTAYISNGKTMEKDDGSKNSRTTITTRYLITGAIRAKYY